MYTIIQKTYDDFRQFHVTSQKDNHIDEKEHHRFVNMYENYRTASHAASQSQNNKIQQATNKRDTPKPNTFLIIYLFNFNINFNMKK